MPLAVAAAQGIERPVREQTAAWTAEGPRRPLTVFETGIWMDGEAFY
jgi:hypothetical protein